MSAVTYKNAGKQPFMSVVKELVRTYQAFTALDAAGLRRFDLTEPQADVVFTLGNTEGMTCKEIGDLTLITKGTLTGVIDRLEAKGIVKRVQGEDDRRCTKVMLTNRGISLFQDTFPKQVSFLKERFDRLSPDERSALEVLLKKLRNVL